MSKNKISKSNNSKSKNNKTKEVKKENFNNDTGSPSDLIDLISVSQTAADKNNVTWDEQLQDYGIIFLKHLFLVSILTLNFLGLSVSLNCNADQETFQRVLSAIFAFFFGIVYLIVNYYTYKVLGQGKICKMDREKLFPFSS